MKIGFLITYFYPKTGGAENNCFFLAKELAKKHEVHVFCSGEEDKDEKIFNINVHRCKEIFRIKYYLAFYPSIVNKLLNSDLDILHIQGFGFIQHDIAVKKLKNKNPNLKIVCTPHGPFMALKKYNIFGRLFKKFYEPKIKNAVKNYDALIQVNPTQYKWMNEIYNFPKEKVKFIPNGIVKETFKKISKEKRNKILKKYNLLDLHGKILVTYMGRIQKYKGLDQVIRAISDSELLREKVIFLAIGNDVGDRKRLEELSKDLKVEKNILFTGKNVYGDEKLAILDSSEIFVFPSEWEAFGIVVLEAMARGNAVISSKTEGGLYLVKEEKNGFLYDFGEFNKLKFYLEKLVKNNSLVKKLKNNNIKKAKRFIWEDIAKDLEKLYISLIKK